MIASIVIFAVATLASIGLTPLVIRLADKWDLYDTPHGDRRVHTEPVPRVGGVAVFASMWIGLLVMALAATVGGVEPLGSMPPTVETRAITSRPIHIDAKTATPPTRGTGSVWTRRSPCGVS